MSETKSTRQWSEPALLRAIPNPDAQLHYTIRIENPEVTFLGAKEQPDFAAVTINYVPGQKVVELKSLKKYFCAFRNVLISYERFISVVFADLMRTYEPRQLVLTAVFNPRGGMTSTLVADSTKQPEGEAP